jgi:hypothetical protein
MTIDGWDHSPLAPTTGAFVLYHSIHSILLPTLNKPASSAEFAVDGLTVDFTMDCGMACRVARNFSDTLSHLFRICRDLLFPTPLHLFPTPPHFGGLGSGSAGGLASFIPGYCIYAATYAPPCAALTARILPGTVYSNRLKRAAATPWHLKHTCDAPAPPPAWLNAVIAARPYSLGALDVRFGLRLACACACTCAYQNKCLLLRLRPYLFICFYAPPALRLMRLRVRWIVQLGSSGFSMKSLYCEVVHTMQSSSASSSSVAHFRLLCVQRSPLSWLSSHSRVQL